MGGSLCCLLDPYTDQCEGIPFISFGSTTDWRTESESEHPKVFTLTELTTITKNFRRQVLNRSLRRMYKGRLRNGQHVVVKLLDGNIQQREQEFLAEVKMLSLLHHPNLVTLIGYCSTRDQRLIVHEYMPLGSLDHYIYDLPLHGESLDWKTRMKIALGVAKGLEYLHDKADQTWVFGDFNSSKVFLGKDFHPKLWGFGRAAPYADIRHMCNLGHEKYPYCAPEYLFTRIPTPKCDVYGFGVVLLELITGRKHIDTEDRLLVMWARRHFKDPSKFYRLADPQLKECFSRGGLLVAVAIAAMCLHKDPDRRPVMREVVAALTYLEAQDYDPKDSFGASPFSLSYLFTSAMTDLGRKETGFGVQNQP